VKSTLTHYMCQNLTQNLQLYSGIQNYNFNLKSAAAYHVYVYEHIHVEKYQSFILKLQLKENTRSISYPNCFSLYLLNFHSILKMVVIMLYFYYVCPAVVKIMLFITQSKKLYNLICMYRRLLATMSPLSFYVLHYGSQYFSGLK